MMTQKQRRIAQCIVVPIMVGVAQYMGIIDLTGMNLVAVRRRHSFHDPFCVFAAPVSNNRIAGLRDFLACFKTVV